MANKYKNPPIKEVVCEFRFEKDNSIDSKTVDLFFDQIKETFTTKKKAKKLEVSFKVDLKSKKPRKDFAEDYGEFEQFFSDDKKMFVQLDEGRLSIHKLKPYVSWERFYPLIKLVFEAYTSVIEVQSISRIGLRYINNFEIPEVGFKIGKYFNFRPEVKGDNLPKQYVSFYLGTIFAYHEGRDNAKVQLLDRMTDDNKPFFTLDIDYFLTQPKVIKKNNAVEWVDQAHSEIENIFEASITEKTKKLFG